MRIWSVHPKYLDSKGIVALWRETLLAKNVLENKTKGYKNHPQLNRFKDSQNALYAINFYLSEVYYESVKRNYKFDRSKINWNFKPLSINVNSGQLKYEYLHLLKKLKTRDYQRYITHKNISVIEPHPLFKVLKGEVENWEIT